jgi:hypothetical protein
LLLRGAGFLVGGLLSFRRIEDIEAEVPETFHFIAIHAGEHVALPAGEIAQPARVFDQRSAPLREIVQPAGHRGDLGIQFIGVGDGISRLR